MSARIGLYLKNKLSKLSHIFCTCYIQEREKSAWKEDQDGDDDGGDGGGEADSIKHSDDDAPFTLVVE